MSQNIRTFQAWRKKFKINVPPKIGWASFEMFCIETQSKPRCSICCLLNSNTILRYWFYCHNWQYHAKNPTFQEAYTRECLVFLARKWHKCNYSSNLLYISVFPPLPFLHIFQKVTEKKVTVDSWANITHITPCHPLATTQWPSLSKNKNKMSNRSLL